MTDVTVRDNPGEGRFEAWLGDRLAGVAVYRSHPGYVTVLHTEVPDEFSGKGVAGALARGALDDLRSRGLQVQPWCPFLRGWIDKHPDYQGLVRS